MVVRHRYYRNGEPAEGSTLHTPYLKPAATLLDAVKRRMQMGNLQQLAQRYVTEDGAVLTAISRFGQDEIRIDVPVTVKPKGGKRMREYCVWGPDRAIYSEPIDTKGNGASGGFIVGDFVYYGLADPGDYANREVLVLDAKTLVQKDAFSTGMITGSVGSWSMRLDTSTNRITWGAYDYGNTQGNYLEQWVAGEQAISTFNLSAYNHFASESSFIITPPHGGISQLVTDASRLVINMAYSDEAPPWESHNVWIVTDSTTNAVLLELVDPAWSPSFLDYDEVTAYVTPGGDTIFIVSPVLQVGDRLFRYGTGAAAITQEYPIPEVASTLAHGTNPQVTVVSLNDDKTLFLRIANTDTTVGDYLFQWDGSSWQPIVLATPFIRIGAWERGLLHDPETDCVASIDGNGAGAWIFNAKDCLGSKMPPFYFPFENPPGDVASCNQFYDGSLFVTFYAGAPGEVTAEVIVARFDIGRLKQTKLSEEIAGE